MFSNPHKKRVRKDYQFFPSGQSKTDPSQQKMCCINNIIKTYAKTGHLPQFKEKIPQYMNTCDLPTFMEAQITVTNATNMFNELPADIRALMSNDPANMEKFFQDEENHQLLLKHGVLEKTEPPKKENLLTPEDIENINKAVKGTETK